MAPATISKPTMMATKGPMSIFHPNTCCSPIIMMMATMSNPRIEPPRGSPKHSSSVPSSSQSPLIFWLLFIGVFMNCLIQVSRNVFGKTFLECLLDDFGVRGRTRGRPFLRRSSSLRCCFFHLRVLCAVLRTLP